MRKQYAVRYRTDNHTGESGRWRDAYRGKKGGSRDKDVRASKYLEIYARTLSVRISYVTRGGTRACTRAYSLAQLRAYD